MCYTHKCVCEVFLRGAAPGSIVFLLSSLSLFLLYTVMTPSNTPSIHHVLWLSYFMIAYMLWFFNKCTHKVKHINTHSHVDTPLSLKCRLFASTHSRGGSKKTKGGPTAVSMLWVLLFTKNTSPLMVVKTKDVNCQWLYKMINVYYVGNIE